MSTRALVRMALAAMLLHGSFARAETTVPIELQVELLRKLVRFERGFVTRAESPIVVLIATRAADAASVRATAQLREALGHAKDIVGKPVRIVVLEYVSAKALRAALDADNVALAVFAPALDAELAGIAGALVGRATITMTTDGDSVPSGAVVGFELQSSKPKIVLNLAQARRQRLDFDSDLFRLCKVIE